MEGPEWSGLPLQAHQVLGRLYEGSLAPAGRQRGVAAGGDGVVDHYVDPAQLGDRLGHAASTCDAVPHVTGDRTDGDTPLAHLFSRPLRPFALQLRDRDAGAFRRQRSAMPKPMPGRHR